MQCDTFLPKSYCLSVITKLWKKSNQQKSLLLLPFKENPFKKNCNKETPQILHYFFPEWQRNLAVVTNGLSIVQFEVMWVLLLCRLTFAFSQPAVILGLRANYFENKFVHKPFKNDTERKKKSVFHFSLDVTCFFYSPVFERNESEMLNGSRSNYASTWKLNTHSKAYLTAHANL